MLLFRLGVYGPRYNSVQLVLFLTVFPGPELEDDPWVSEKVVPPILPDLHLSFPKTLIVHSYISDYPNMFNFTNPKYISSTQKKWIYKIPLSVTQTDP